MFRGEIADVELLGSATPNGARKVRLNVVPLTRTSGLDSLPLGRKRQVNLELAVSLLPNP